MPLKPLSSSSTPSILPAWILDIDRRVGGRINARLSHPRVDSALVRLSTTANNGVIWYVAASVLACTGPSGRRAAVRGLLSLGGASAFANLVAKPIFGGPRPLAVDVPAARHLKAFPASASFPSGHTASAFAFATGAALEMPVSALVLAPVATAIAYSRLHVGAHWLSDVAGGALIGSGVALVGRLLVRGRR